MLCLFILLTNHYFIQISKTTNVPIVFLSFSNLSMDIYKTGSNAVVRRKKEIISDDEDRPMRRVSYLRATANENTLKDTEDTNICSSPIASPAYDGSVTQLMKSGGKTKALSCLRATSTDIREPITIASELNIKITFIDGKKSTDRAWRTVLAELRGSKLKMTICREGKSIQVSTIKKFTKYHSFGRPNGDSSEENNAIISL